MLSGPMRTLQSRRQLNSKDALPIQERRLGSSDTKMIPTQAFPLDGYQAESR